ncbi:MAG: transcriptional regulator NrdR [Acidimicrobiales bacterium]
MRCPNCSVSDDHVVDSREVDHSQAVRRRRECRNCGYRFTTFERLAEAVVFVVKRSGEQEPFQLDKVVAGVRAATKNRPVDDDQIMAVAKAVEDHIRALGTSVSTEQIGVSVLDQLKELDEVAYIRFASVYKGFENLSDFEREAGLLTKSTAPKRHTQHADQRAD